MVWKYNVWACLPSGYRAAAWNFTDEREAYRFADTARAGAIETVAAGLTGKGMWHADALPIARQKAALFVVEGL